MKKLVTFLMALMLSAGFLFADTTKCYVYNIGTGYSRILIFEAVTTNNDDEIVSDMYYPYSQICKFDYKNNIIVTKTSKIKCSKNTFRKMIDKIK